MFLIVVFEALFYNYTLCYVNQVRRKVQCVIPYIIEYFYFTKAK
jgi:hypothetical protein